MLVYSLFLMKRKVVKHGPSSLIISLPSKWVKRHNVKGGDELDVLEKQNSLEITTKALPKDLSVTIDITGLDRTSILVYLQGMYRKGYDEINVHFKNQKTKHFRKKKEVQVLSVIQNVITRFIGVEIVKQTKDFVQIRQISEDSKKDFAVLMKRTGMLIIEAFEEFERCLKDNDDDTYPVEHHHMIVTKFINYCMRLISKGAVKDTSDALTLYQIFAVLDKIMDLLKEAERDKARYNISFPKESVEIVSDVTEAMRVFHKFFFSKDLKLAYDLESRRDKIKQKIYAMKSDPKVLSIMVLFREIPEFLQVLVECRLRLDGEY